MYTLYDCLIKQFNELKIYLKTDGLELPQFDDKAILNKLKQHHEVITNIVAETEISKHLLHRYKQDLDIIRKTLKIYFVFKKDNVDMLFDILPNDINDFDEYDETLLMKAVTHESDNVIIKLLELGADPFVSDKHGNTAFSIALGKGNQKYAKEFIKRKVNDYDISIKEPDGEFELFIAKNICKKHSHLRKLLDMSDRCAITCFGEAESYCYATLGNSIDLSNDNELI